MKKTILLTILFVSTFSTINAQFMQLEGKWTLFDLKTDATIYKAKSKAESIAIKSNSDVSPAETTPVKLRTYLLNEMSLNITKFIFENEKFEFYRKGELTFKGTYKIVNNVMILKFNHKGIDNSKEMKLISLTQNELILESKSHNRPFILIFNR